MSLERRSGNSAGIGIGGVLVIAGIVIAIVWSVVDRRDRCGDRAGCVRWIRARQVVLSDARVKRPSRPASHCVAPGNGDEPVCNDRLELALDAKRRERLELGDSRQRSGRGLADHDFPRRGCRL